LKSRFKEQDESDIREWLDAVDYPDNCSEIPRTVISDTFSGLKQAGVVDGDFDMERFVDSRVVTLTG